MFFISNNNDIRRLSSSSLASVIRRISPKRIWQQVFLVLFFLVVFPLVLMGSLLLQTSQKAIKTTVQRDHQQIAIQATGKIQEHINGAREALFVTAAILGTLHADAWRQETAIVELSLRNSAFQRISSVNKLGKEIVTSELGTNLRDRVSEFAFQEAIKGRSFISEVRISDSYIPFITLAEPVKQLGKVKNVLMADLNLRGVWNVIDDIRIGQLGIAYLIDETGRIIAHPDKRLVLQNAIFTHPKVIQQMLAGQTGNIVEKDQKGELWLTTYAPVKKFNWGLIITQPQNEVLVFSRQMKMHSIILIVVSVLAALLISFVMAQYMSHPIKKIIEGTRRMVRGDYSQTFQVHGRSEMDKLLFSFKRMSRKLKKAQESEKLTVIGMATTAMIHELKNSLQLVNTFVQLLPQRYQDKQFIKEFSETIPKELESWNGSLKNVMTYSKNFQFQMNEVNLKELIKDLTLLVKLKARQLDIDFEADLREEIPAILGNEEKLKQALLNILTNALEATPSGGRIVLKTRVIEESKFPYVEIEIKNTGEGIKQEHLNKLFDPFYSTKSGGLGLGLTITKEIIDSHKGQIDIVSVENETTSFIIKIPSYQTDGALKKSQLKTT